MKRVMTLFGMALTIFFALPAAAQDTTTGLVGHWRMDETSGTTVMDSSPSANHGTTGANVSGASQPKLINRSFRIAGSGHATDVAAAPYNNLNQVTIAFWAKPYQISGYMNVLNGSGLTISNQWDNNAISLRVSRWSGNAGSWAYYSSPYKVNEWRHYAFTYDFTGTTATKPKLYVDGVERTLTTVDTPSGTIGPSTSTTMTIGHFSSSSHYFKGNLDDFRLYNRVLSADDIYALANAYEGPVTCNAAHEGVMIFNYNDKVMEYCNGANWIATGSEARTCNPGITSCGGKANERLVFITHDAWQGQGVGGVTGADAKCNQEALTYNLHGNYMAWIADSTTASAPTTRFEQSYSPYVLVNGTKIADNWADLTDNSLDAAISRRPDNTTVPDGIYYAWSNVASTGDRLSSTNAMHCSNWAALPASPAGHRGVNTSSDGNWTNNYSGGLCNNNARLYCFEQAATAASAVCTNPSGGIGEMNYNASEGVMQYCNGTRWIAMGPKIAGEGEDASSLSPVATSSGLIGHWTLNDTNATAIDSSASALNGTMQGGLTGASNSVPAQIGAGLNFDGTNDYIDMGTSATLKPALPVTMAAWIKYDALNGIGFPIVRSDFQSGLYSGFWMSVNDTISAIGVHYGDNGGAGPSSRRSKHGSTTLAADTWYHVAAVVRGPTDMDIYVNGVNDGGSYSGTGSPMVYTSGPFVIGRSDAGYADGIIDDVRFYNRALTETEISTIYKSSSLVGHWKLDETTGTTAADSSGYGYNGTLTGTTFPATTVAGINGTAVNLDGNNDWIDTVNLDFNRGGYTLSTWAKSGSAGNMRLLSKYSTGGNQKWMMLLASGEFECGASGASGIGTVTGVNLFNNQWHHYACVVNDTNITAYVDGVPSTPVAHTNSLLTNSAIWRIGARNDGAEDFLGAMDDARIYNRALSGAEIALLYGATGGNAGSISNCSTIGNVCDNGSVYAGLSPDQNLPMYTTQADLGQYSWNDGNTNFVTVGGTSSTSGSNNTSTIIAADSNSVATGIQPHNAAKACADLVAHGDSDWYLPALNELNVLYTNRLAIGGFNLSGTNPSGFYWTSTNNGAGNARNQDFSDGSQINFGGADNKDWLFSVRCVRKGYLTQQLGACSNPSGVGGEMVYNDDFNVMQFCNGERWVATTSIVESSTTTPPDIMAPVWTTAAGTITTTYINTSLSSGLMVTATDDSGTVTYSKASGDAWISVNSSGEISGTAPGLAGTYSITVTATDPTGNNVSRTFDIVVQTDPCAGSPSAGQICADGSIYFTSYNYGAGAEKIYVTNTNQSTSSAWKTSTGTNDIATDSTTDGKLNHAQVSPIANFPAFNVCDALNRHSKTDWYLPSQNELALLYNNRAAINASSIQAFSTTGSYWASTETTTTQARYYYFQMNIQNQQTKTNTYNIRCIRRD